MFKKSILVLILAMILSAFSTNSFVQAASSYIDKTNLRNGLVSINYNSKNKSAVRIEKGNQKQDYILDGNNNFPLQFGDGEYTITVLENTNGNKYKQIEKEVFTLKSGNKNDVYLQSIQLINWNNEMNAIKKAKELTKNSKTDKEKVTEIYNYIVKNISYDYNKASTVAKGYVPSIDDVLKSSKGICYDYSSLFAGMLRSIDIPTKLVMGNNSEIKEYHAWNEVYLKDIGEWIIIDTTYDVAMKKGNVSVPMIKNASQYKIEKQY
jgi:transglutaminase-like putative cysteine protease